MSFVFYSNFKVNLGFVCSLFQCTALASNRALLRWTSHHHSGSRLLEGFSSCLASLASLCCGRESMVRKIKKIELVNSLVVLNVVTLYPLPELLDIFVEIIYFQCMDLFHTHLRRSTNRRSCSGCWTWGSTQWRAFHPIGITKTSSGKNKSLGRPQHILEKKSRPTQRYNNNCILYLSLVSLTSVCAFLEGFFL